MLHTSVHGSAFRPATHDQGTQIRPGLGILLRSIANVCTRKRITPRADGFSLGLRSGSKAWADTWGEIQTEIFAAGAREAHHGLRPHADRLGIRADAFTPGAAMFGSQDLIQAYGKVYEEKVAPSEYARVFSTESKIAIGADSYRIRSHQSTGMAALYNMGDRVEPVSVGVVEAIRPMHTFATVHEMPWLLNQQGQFAGYDVDSALLRAQRQAHDLTIDELSWNGSDDIDCIGLANYPGLPTYDTGLVLTSITGPQMAQAFIGAMRRPVERSKTAMRPTILDVAPEIMTWALTLTMGSDTKQTVAAWFTSQPNGAGGNYQLREAHRLSDIGGSNVHGMFAHGDNDSTFILEVMPPLVIPGPASDWGQSTYVISRTGGLFNPYPTGAELAFIDEA